jgi:hypothetical protein
MKRWGWLTLALVLAMTGGGCSTVKETVADYAYMARERGLSEAYVESLQQWSREETAYSQFETRFHISATYKSPAFREAFLKEQARLLALPPEAQEKREAQERDHAADWGNFSSTPTRRTERSTTSESDAPIAGFLLDEAGRQVEPLGCAGSAR